MLLPRPISGPLPAEITASAAGRSGAPCRHVDDHGREQPREGGDQQPREKSGDPGRGQRVVVLSVGKAVAPIIS